MQISARGMRAQKDDDGDEKSFQNYSLKYFLKFVKLVEKATKRAKKFFEKAKTEKDDDGGDEKSFQNCSLKYILFQNSSIYSRVRNRSRPYGY